MDLKVIFSPTSIRDLSDSVAYIARHNKEAAARVGEGLIDIAEKHLSQFPLSGPVCDGFAGSNIRYWLHGNYRIVYEVNENTSTVNVLRFWHCARGDWPNPLT